MQISKSLASAGIRNRGHAAYCLVTTATTETVPTHIRLFELFVVIILKKNIPPNSNGCARGGGVVNTIRKGDNVISTESVILVAVKCKVHPIKGHEV